MARVLGRTGRGCVALALATLLVGCGSEPPEGSLVGDARPAGAAASSAAQEQAAQGRHAGESQEQQGRSVQPDGAQSSAPSVPPGDPGLDAPSVPDPGNAPAKPHGHQEPRRKMPVSAMLTAETVRMMLGGPWQRHAGGADECLRPEGELGSRSTSYGGTDAGLVVETVATFPDSGAADAAIGELERAARACGWEDVRDPRLASAAVAADDGARSAVAVSSEGVVVLLVGTGDVTRGVGWGSLVDMALGSSCAAAPDGCH